jgi:hypothetical protein
MELLGVEWGGKSRRQICGGGRDIFESFGSISCTCSAEAMGLGSGGFHLLSPADGGSTNSLGAPLPGPTLGALEREGGTVGAERSRGGILSRLLKEEPEAFSETFEDVSDL